MHEWVVAPWCNYIMTTTTILRLSGLCPGQPAWAGTRRNIHPLTPIVVINHPLSASSIFYNSWHPPCSIYVTDGLFPQSLSPSFLWSTSWLGTLQFILHTFLHPIIVFFLQHMPIPDYISAADSCCGWDGRPVCLRKHILFAIFKVRTGFARWHLWTEQIVRFS